MKTIRLRAVLLAVTLLSSGSLSWAAGKQLPMSTRETLPQMTLDSLLEKPYFAWEGVVYDFSEAITKSEENETFKFHHGLFLNKIASDNHELREQDIRLHQRGDEANALLEYMSRPGKAIGVLVDQDTR